MLYCNLTRFSRPDRLREIADRFNLDQNAMLDNVLYCRAYTSKNRLQNYFCGSQNTTVTPGLKILDIFFCWKHGVVELFD